MSFIQIGFLGALAALAIPIIVHLVFGQRARRVDLGTLRFLRVVMEHNARRRRIMRWLLLTLRLACIALLAFLFARPYLLAARAGGEKQTVAILIDQSATMELQQDGVRAVERAIAAAQELLRQSAANSRFEVALFDHAVYPLAASKGIGRIGPMPQRELTGIELANALKPTEVCHGATDYGAAMEWARDVLTKAPPGPRSLHVFTDFQRSGLAWTEVEVLAENVQSQLHDLGRAAVNNIAVTEARAERAWLRPDEQTAVHVTVYNGGPFTASEVPVVLTLASQGRKIEFREQARLEPGSLESLRFDLTPLPEGLWQGSVSVEVEDDLPMDNARPLALLAAPPYQVLLADGRDAPSAALASTYFLEAALRLAPPGELYSASPFEPQWTSAKDGLPDLKLFDCIVLSDVANLDRSSSERLAQRVNQGAGLLVFCGENVTAEGTASLAQSGLTVGRITGISHTADLPWRLRSWDGKHPIFSLFNDPQLGDLRRLSFSACTAIRPAKDATVLATFGDDHPAVIERRVGQGTVVWLTTTCDRQWSEWTRSRLYLPLVYQLLGYQSGLAAGGKVRQEVLEGSRPRTAPAAPGVYPQETHTLVVTRSPRESETERCTLAEFAARFGLQVKEQAAATEASPQLAAMGAELINHELWPWLAVCLLVGVVLEGLIANRTAG